MNTSRPEMRTSDAPDETNVPRGVFVTTHWSLVLAAVGKDEAQAQYALEKLCQLYWYPLYAYVRRRGYGAHDGQDLVQEFFARLLRRHWLAQADRQRGKFRTFLLTAMNHFLANEWDKAKAEKRGGKAHILPLELDTAETRYQLEACDPLTPEQNYERRWVLALLDQVLVRLRKEHEVDGKETLFETLKPSLVGEREAQPYAALAAQLNLSEGAVKVAVHRLRQRYRQLLQEEIAQTVAGPEEIEDEVRYLLAVLGR